jgi:hypothetical protein
VYGNFDFNVSFGTNAWFLNRQKEPVSIYECEYDFPFLLYFTFDHLRTCAFLKDSVVIQTVSCFYPESYYTVIRLTVHIGQFTPSVKETHIHTLHPWTHKNALSRLRPRFYKPTRRNNQKKEAKAEMEERRKMIKNYRRTGDWNKILSRTCNYSMKKFAQPPIQWAPVAFLWE